MLPGQCQSVSLSFVVSHRMPVSVRVTVSPVARRPSSNMIIMIQYR